MMMNGSLGEQGREEECILSSAVYLLNNQLPDNAHTNTAKHQFSYSAQRDLIQQSYAANIVWIDSSVDFVNIASIFIAVTRPLV